MAGCSIAHKFCILHVSRWGMDQTKNYMSNPFFSKVVSVVYGSYHSVSSSKFDFGLVFDTE